jgi:diguanylate cyclase
MDNTTNNTEELFQKALSELKKYNIAVMPKCYEVMFEYVKGDNIEINKAFDKFIDHGGVINQAFLLKVHSTVLSYDTMAKTVDTVTSMLTAHISGLHQSVSSSDEELNIFTTAVDSFSKHIYDNSDDISLPEYDNNIVHYITGATERVKNKIQDLEKELEYSQAEIKKLYNHLDSVCQETMIDGLTTLITRKRLDQVLLKEIKNAIETAGKLSIAFIEVDNYDAFKKKWGQVTSEQILRFVASSIKENIKGRDSAARYSESLFMITLPRTDARGAAVLAEYIRSMIESKRIIKKTTGEFLGRVTISVGIAQFQEGESLGYFISRTEMALSVARDNGKNCIAIEGTIHTQNKDNGSEQNKIVNG